MKFGAHMSVSGGAWRGLQRGRSIGCEVIQIFVKNILVSPMQFPRKFEVFGFELLIAVTFLSPGTEEVSFRHSANK